MASNSHQAQGFTLVELIPGAMNKLGNGLEQAGMAAGPVMVIGLIYLCTVVLSLFLSTSATAVIMLPIAFEAA